ncbi:alpha/beta hydrolase family protein [Phytohabitans suffuscus]
MKRFAAGLVGVVLLFASAACGAQAPHAVSHVSAPRSSYPVGIRMLALSRGEARPLPTTVWYPAIFAGRDAPVAAGRFPVVVYSHGLHGLPAYHAQIISRWVSAGFVVAAPAYPRTRKDTRRFSRADVRNQPADAWYVVREVVALPAFAGHLDASRIGAAGHSAGGYTTAGLFTAGHDRRLRGGIVIAGAGMAGAFAGPRAAVLFVHGTADPTVPIEAARAAYDRVRWPKAFLALPGQDHGAYLTPGRPGFDRVLATTLDFLRWTLYDDPAARGRLALVS